MTANCRARLTRYSDSLIDGAPGRSSRREVAYEIHSDADGPALRRLATLMDALALALGPRSKVGLALSSWASRILVAVAEAQVGVGALEGPPDDLLALVRALGRELERPEPRVAESEPRAAKATRAGMRVDRTRRWR